MSTEQCVQALWESHQRGDFFPQAWRGKLELTEAYRVQLGLLDRKVAGGERQAGWKIGLTADVMREMFGGKEPVMEAYRHAVEQKYRFYSYGDCMFVA